jgi:alpha-tubulin suppressor-like RCC1 family protein
MGIKGIELVDTPTRLVLPNKEIPKKVACGCMFSICLTESKKAFAWGANGSGQLGLGEGGNPVGPVEIKLPEPLSDIACGHFTTLGISESGFLYVWGKGVNGELGLQDTNYAAVPTPNPCGIIFSKVFGGSCHSLGLTPAGDLYGWGWNGYGNMGNGNLDDSLVPTLLQTDIENVATGGSHVLVLKKNGELWGWGHNGHGQLGTGDIKEEVTEPRKILINISEDPDQPPKKISFIGCGWRHSFALLENGEFYIWGGNGDLQTGSPETGDIRSPKKTGFKLRFPIQEYLRYTLSKWTVVYQWVFMGMFDPGSAFSLIPVEVVFHMVSSTVHKL